MNQSPQEQYQHDIRTLHFKHNVNLYGPAEIFAPLPPRPPNAGVLAQGTLNLLTGRYGTVKTFVALDSAVAAACGQSVLGWSPRPPMWALYLDYENPPHEMRRRIQRLAPGRGAGPNLGLFLASGGLPRMHTPLFDDYLADAAQRAQFIIIDSLRRANAAIDENSSAITSGIETLRRLASMFGTTFLIIHHQGKGSDPVRGSSAILDAVDSAWLAEKNEDGSTLLKMLKDRCNLGHVHKLVHLEDREDGSLLLRHQDVEDDDRGAAEGTDLSSMIIEHFRAHPGSSWDECRKHLPGSSKAKQSAFERLKVDGTILKNGHGSYHVAKA